MKAMSAAGHERVFPDLRNTRNGYGDAVSRWFRRWRLRYGVDDKRKVLHSFRNTVATRLKYADVQEFAIAELLGHQNESISTGSYATKLPVKRLAETVRKLDFGDALAALTNSVQRD